jgi:hypothetical protein
MRNRHCVDARIGPVPVAPVNSMAARYAIRALSK